MEGFTLIIIRIVNEENYLSVNEVETILKVNAVFSSENMSSLVGDI